MELLAISQEPAGDSPVYTVPPIVPAGFPHDATDYSKDPRFIARKAAAKLYSLGVQAYPELLKHLSDNRQSIPQAPVIPCSLGTACFFIIANQINPNPGQENDLRFLRGGDADMLLWWREREGRSLLELQVEARVFELALAEFDRIENRIAFMKEWLREHRIEDVENRKAAVVEALKVLGLSLEDRELVDSLAPRKEGSYLQRRVARERARRSWELLYDRGLDAFPALVQALEREGVGDRCYGLLEHLVDGTSFHEDHPDFAFFSRSTFAGWWKARKGKSLRELRVETARHHLEAASKIKFQSPEERDSVLRFLTYRLSEVDR